MDNSQYIYLIYFLFFLGALLFALLTNNILLRFAVTLGSKNQSNADHVARWSAQTKPAIGGITFFIIFLLSLVCYSIFFEPEEVFKNRQLLGVIIAIMLAFTMGLADDAYNTRPLLKLLVQVLCGVLLVLTDTSIQVFDSIYVNGLLTVIWVVGIMNSINMLDNMDAITTVVSVFIFLTALVSIHITGNLGIPDVMMICGSLAALTGFLFFNWHPSKMFMGDTGSQFLGLLLAYIGIKYCWNVESIYQGPMISQQIAITTLVFMLPIVDTTIVVINRVMRGQSPFVGGRDHTTHILSYQGLTDSQVALSFAGFSALSMSIAAFILRFVSIWTIWHALFVLAYFLLILGVMFYLSLINKHRYIA